MSFAIAHDDISSKRRGDFGTWFLKSSEYRRWVAGSEQILFCTGIPGAGKTYIASLVIDDLRDTTIPNDKTVVVAWVYLSYTERRSQTTPNLMRSLLRQLVQGLSELPEEISDLYKSHGEGEIPLSIIESRQALIAVARLYDQGFIEIGRASCRERVSPRV